MKAVFAAEPNAEDPLSGLRFGERPDPEPGPGEVRVAVRAASLNMHDVFTLRGVGLRPERFPMILGCDGAGVLEDGTEVVVHGVVATPGWRGDETLDPRRTLLSELWQGTMAEYVVLPEYNVVPKPPELSFADAACLGTAWLTAYRMLFVKSGLRPGQTALVQGASGGVSTALVALGAAAGIRMFATARTEEKQAVAKSLGAERTFESGARLPERVDVVFDSVGRATWSHSMRSLRPGGAVVTCGATTGDPTAAEIQRLFFTQLRVIGSTMGTRDELEHLIAFLVASGVRPTVGASLPLADAATGFAAMVAGETAGKTVLTTN
ncbi:Zn-dependent oxidoreductase [Actinophytocola xinjiangensis]|uniref:Zn-dependent oxidoreductase n=1 Tax=Actinophytocola xinjiangensis TaxID=485602 RepID=A0A7Z1AVY6_9PSEU|nr:zinc-binding dehydrogenase [Actinophytocola xinjiangensis]OLF07314.1 Zn-dependent oxidoreductase [Actinophytocola xinjiangensis]